MDIYCQHCGEPYDACYVGSDMEHEAPNGKQRFLNGEGCPCCDWGQGEAENDMRSLAMGACADLLGDDIDGMASMMDAFEYMGYFE
jgi:hypothetical protein